MEAECLKQEAEAGEEEQRLLSSHCFLHAYFVPGCDVHYAV